MASDNNKIIRAQLERVLQSPRFRTKDRLAWVLRYVVEKALDGRPEEITERAIAKDVFGERFVPGEEKGSSARTAMHDLRGELTDYYFNEGCNDDVLIQLRPKEYAPKFRLRSEAKPLLPQAAVTPTSDNSNQVVGDLTSPGDSGRTKGCIIFDFEKINDALTIEPALRQSCGDPTLRLLQLQFGSVMVYFEASLEGYFRLVSAWKNQTLAPILGPHVKAIRLAELVDDELRASRPHVLEECVTPIIDLSSIPTRDVKFVMYTMDELREDPRFDRSARTLRYKSEDQINDVMVEINLFGSWDSRNWQKVEADIYLADIYQGEEKTDFNTMMLTALVKAPQIRVELSKQRNAAWLALRAGYLTADKRIPSWKVFVELRVVHRFPDDEATFAFYIKSINMDKAEVQLRVDTVRRAARLAPINQSMKPASVEQRLDASQSDIPLPGRISGRSED